MRGTSGSTFVVPVFSPLFSTPGNPSGLHPRGARSRHCRGNPEASRTTEVWRHMVAQGTTVHTFDEHHTDQIDVGVSVDHGYDQGPQQVGWRRSHRPTLVTDLGYEWTSVGRTTRWTGTVRTLGPAIVFGSVRFVSDGPVHSGHQDSFWARFRGHRCLRRTTTSLWGS